MKILLATDGTTFSERAVNGVASRSWRRMRPALWRSSVEIEGHVIIA